jgi:hypothetical protein
MFMVIMFPSVMNIALPGTGLFSWIGTAYSTGKTHCVDFDEEVKNSLEPLKTFT